MQSMRDRRLYQVTMFCVVCISLYTLNAIQVATLFCFCPAQQGPAMLQRHLSSNWRKTRSLYLTTLTPFGRCQYPGILSRLCLSSITAPQLTSRLNFQVKPAEIKFKHKTRNALALDSQQASIALNDVVKVVEGPYSVRPRFFFLSLLAYLFGNFFFRP